MSLNIGNLVTAFAENDSKVHERLWNPYFSYIATISDKQSCGVTRMLLKSSKAARASLPNQLKKVKQYRAGLIRGMIRQWMLADRKSLIEFSLEILLGSVDQTLVSAHDFKELFASLTQAEFDESIVPSVERALRRSASRSIPRVVGILEHSSSCDMSSAVQVLVPVLLGSVSSSELVSAIAQSVGFIFRSTGSDESRLALLGLVDKSFTKLGQQSVDLAACAVLRTLAQSATIISSTVSDALITSPVIAGLIKQLKTSPSEDVKCAAASAVGTAVALVCRSSSANPSANRIIAEELSALLQDKKTTDRVKESILVILHEISESDSTFSLSLTQLPLDSLLPFLPLLSQGRLSARQSCLAAWAVLLHILRGDSTPTDKRLATIFAQSVSSDSTFNPIPGEDSLVINKLLRSIARDALHIPSFPVTSAGEQETISLGSLTERMRNRFPVCLLRIISLFSMSTYTFPSNVSRETANRLAQAMYEIVVDATAGGRGLSGEKARVALTRISSLIGKMDADFAALTVLLSYHEFFAARSHKRQPRWTVPVSKLSGEGMEALMGLIAQAGRLESGNTFQSAALGAVKNVLSNNDEWTKKLVSRAIGLIDFKSVASLTQEDLGVFFCSPQVVYSEATEQWIPDHTNTLAVAAPVLSGKTAGAGGVKSGGMMTKEDMMRQSLKEQGVVRRRIGGIAEIDRFALTVLMLAAPASAPAVAEHMHNWLVLLRSPITAHWCSRMLNGVAGSRLGSLLEAVAVGDLKSVAEEEWVSYMDDLAQSNGALNEIEIAFAIPAIEAVLNPVNVSVFTPSIASAALRALTRQLSLSGPLPIRETLLAVTACSKISPGPFAVPIGKLLRLVSPLITCTSDAALLVSVAITDDAKLLHETLGAVHLLKPSVLTNTTVQAFILMGIAEEAGKVTEPLISTVGEDKVVSSEMINELVRLAATEPLTQRLTALALGYVCRAPPATATTLTTILSACANSGGAAGIGLALQEVSKTPLANNADFLVNLITFVLGSAFTSPATSLSLRDSLLAATQEAITTHGQSHAAALITLTESFIGSPSASVAESVPLLLGLLVKFLPAGDEKVVSVRSKLVSELLTGSAAVQVKIAAVLPPLLKMAEDPSTYVETLLATALSSTDDRARYGAALGVGAAVKAQGVAILRQLEVLKRLQETLEGKHTTPAQRQGAVAVYGGLSVSLGRLFEPYVSQVLPVLLGALSDGNTNVRETATTAATQIMANLSSHGIKLVLPSLLSGVQDLQWRTKLGSIKLLSAMLSCAPKQLATCLPKVVPALSEAATDTHSKVKEAACASLSEVGNVIANPEIKAIAQVLVSALTDPADDNLRQQALDVLLTTSFVHSLDAVSLALVVPVMLRATKERRSDVKRKGAQILGSIAILAADAQEGLGPYMDRIVPALQDVLVDPIPDVRATAAKALGTITRVLPQAVLAEVLPWLLKTLQTADSQVERSGAAHGLSEVLVELGETHFAQILPQVVENAVNMQTHPDAREGYMGLFVFLPSVMRAAFAAYIDVVFPVLVQGLSDPHLQVREVAFRAASAICSQFGASHATLLLPSLEKGLFAKDPRARQASVQLVGDTLEQLMKTSRTALASGGDATLMDASTVPLTQEKRSYMLAMLYIVRSDPNQAVCQNAQSVWKGVVSNTPRTLRLILPILVRLLISNLSASDEETRQMLAGRCLGDLVGKLGERVLPDLMPILIDNLSSDDATVRAGVCVGLAEIATAAHRQLLQEYFSVMFPAVRAALCDDVLSVRKKAGSVVTLLYGTLGNTAVNNLLPPVLEAITSDSGEDEAGAAHKARGLEQLVAALPRELLPAIVESLTVLPATSTKVKAIETVSVAPPGEVSKYAARIVAFLVAAHATNPAESVHAANELFAKFNKQSTHLALVELLRGMGETSGATREACASLLAAGFKFAPVEVLAEYVDSFVPVLARGMLADTYQPAMESCLAAFTELTTKYTKESLCKYMPAIAGAVDDAVAASGSVAGLALPRTFETLWVVYQQALMFGNTESRESAAKGLVVLVKETPTDRLKPNAIKVTGPLIRVLGDRYPANVRIALLQTLELLLTRLESALKPFLPQLQTTYQKCAQDSEAGVRELAEASQSLLAKLTSKPVIG